MSDSLTPDQSAAHRFLAELRTRISTQPLPYQSGVEGRALESLWEVFGQARDAMKEYPGCEKFAAEVSRMLNIELRPVTSKWHRAHSEGRLDSRDGADGFREELADVQQKLREFAVRLHEMAYGKPFSEELCPPVWTAQQLDRCFADLPYGIAPGTRGLSDKLVNDINQDEQSEV